MILKLEELLKNWLTILNFNENNLNSSAAWLTLLLVVASSILIYFLILIVLKKGVAKLIKKTQNNFDDELYNGKFFNQLAYLIPLGIIDNCVNVLIQSHELSLTFINRVVDIFYVIIFLGIISSLLNVLNIVYSKKYKEGRSIKSLIQATKMILTTISVIIIITILFNLKTSAVVGYLGGASAVLMLVFKDTILGFVSSIQLASNRMVLLGDWIEMPQYGADGNVIDISLVTVKVRNWDNTVTTIPTYALVTNSVKNWRAMSESGRRRIKRSVYIDMTSVKFVDQKLLAKLSKVQAIKSYLDSKDKEIEEYNKKNQVDESIDLNGRHQTNLGIFRAYVSHYLKNHPKIDHETSTFLIRQLQPTDMGIPLEIYVFTNTAAWVAYEDIQSDVFDHILASIEYFDLHVYQRPSWNDYRTKELFSLKSSQEKAQQKDVVKNEALKIDDKKLD
ncbi:mechanosensitive ion channel family protein [Bacteroidales bacterium OttesenSCG-928-K03]|nr:mechanosensitive ion channel family protein [Bacteroidales bacterium OttesenSCG-928-K22]MDL2242563.1 mechanosensitive ion channel family protein [Bacteroidales bacterium OttesenSCG-928-K03]